MLRVNKRKHRGPQNGIVRVQLLKTLRGAGATVNLLRIIEIS
jgi:hypothetical protein